MKSKGWFKHSVAGVASVVFSSLLADILKESRKQNTFILLLTLIAILSSFTLIISVMIYVLQ